MYVGIDRQLHGETPGRILPKTLRKQAPKPRSLRHFQEEFESTLR